MTKIPHRSCGPAHETMSVLSLGSWHTWDRAVFEEITVLLRRALDDGINHFDVGVYRSKGPTSIDPYDHPTDLIFAQAMRAIGAKENRDYDIGIKAWLSKPEINVTEQVDNLLWRQGADSAKYVVLGDILYETNDYTELLRQLDGLKKAGKMRYWAVNNWSADQIQAINDQAIALGVDGPQFAQHKYSVCRRTIVEGAPFEALIAKTGISIQASDVMEGGLLFANDSSRIIAIDVGGIQNAIRAKRGALAEAARKLGATPAQVAVAYPLTNPHCCNVLFGARTLEQYNDNLGALSLLERAGPEAIKAAVADLWLDRDVDAAASWSGHRNDTPENYVVVRR